MRLDKYLKISRIIKRRTVANEAADAGRITVNGKVAKPSSDVKAGDVLCLIEAMKLMNEITAEKDGEIVDICAQDGQIVEYGQTVFKIF